MVLVFAEKLRGFGEMPNKVKRKKVRLIDDLVKPKRNGSVEPLAM